MPNNNSKINNNKRSKNTQRVPRPLGKLSGSGDYIQTMRSIGKALKPLGRALKPVAKQALISGGATVGDFVGSKLGMGSTGATAGKILASKLSRLIGTGDYQVLPASANSLLPSPGTKSAYASFQDQTYGTRVSHREYIQDISTGPVAGQFNIQTLPMNPSVIATFPYLAPIAQNFEQYIVKGLVFEFISTTSPYNANSAMGSVIMTCEYNAALPSFTNKASMENSEFALSGRFDSSLMYGVECAENSQNAYYCRGQPGMSALPVTTTDLGDFYIATAPSTTFPTNSIIGELWVSYDIEFRRPRVSGIIGGYARQSTQGPTQSAVGSRTMSLFQPSGAGGVSNQLAALQNGALQNVVFAGTTIQLLNTPPGANVMLTFVSNLYCPVLSSGSFNQTSAPSVAGGNLATIYNGQTSSNAVGPATSQSYSITGFIGTITLVSQIMVTAVLANPVVTAPVFTWVGTTGSYVGQYDLVVNSCGANFAP